MNKIITTGLAGILLLFLYSCTKEGPGGDATISLQVKHHAALIPKASVYIKYDAMESPGTIPSEYDDSKVADENAQTSFEGLKRGAYYVYAVGWDSTISKTVSGGVHIHIKYSERKDVIEEVVAVSEE